MSQNNPQLICRLSDHDRRQGVQRAADGSVSSTEAHAEIMGGPERYIHHGSSLKLVCLLKGATEPPVYVFWYRGERMINYDK